MAISDFYINGSLNTHYVPDIFNNTGTDLGNQTIEAGPLGGYYTPFGFTTTKPKFIYNATLGYLTEVTTQSACEVLFGSWYWTTGKLYVNFGANQPFCYSGNSVRIVQPHFWIHNTLTLQNDFNIKMAISLPAAVEPFVFLLGLKTKSATFTKANYSSTDPLYAVHLYCTYSAPNYSVKAQIFRITSTSTYDQSTKTWGTPTHDLSLVNVGASPNIIFIFQKLNNVLSTIIGNNTAVSTAVDSYISSGYFAFGSYYSGHKFDSLTVNKITVT
jgi:hypothetical protein